MTRRAFARPLVLGAFVGLPLAAVLLSTRTATPRERPASIMQCSRPVPRYQSVAQAYGEPTTYADSSFRGWLVAGGEFAGNIHLRCDFGGADLRGAEMHGAWFRSCDFTAAKLAGADLRGATYDRHTRWPEGFDPRRAGARLVE